MNIFSVSPGVAYVIRDPRTLPMVLAFSRWGGFVVRRSLVQAISVRTLGNFQFSHSLRGFIYVNVFGERMGDLSISGLSLRGRCRYDNTDGISQVIDYYNKERISNRATPVGIRVGRAGFRAFLIGANFAIHNPGDRVGQFQLQFKLLPPVR